MGDTTVEAPAPINPAQVGADSLATQLRLAPDVYAGEAQYRPQYAALDQRILADSLMGTNGTPGLLDLYGTAATRMGQQQVDANTQQREADIADVTRLGGAAQQAWRGANPELTRTMGSLDAGITRQRSVMPREIGPIGARPGNLGPASMMENTDAQAGKLGAVSPYDAATFSATGVRDSALTPRLMDDAMNYGRKSPLQTELESQAGADLAAGGKLSASELADAQQGVRSAYAARGLNDSNGAVTAEVLATDAARTAKLDRARQFAAGTDASGQAQLQAGRSFAVGVEDSLLGRSQFNAASDNTAAATNAAATNAARATNSGAANQFALSQYGTEADIAARNAAARTAASGTNAGAANQFALSQFGSDTDLARSNSALDLQRQMANLDFSRATTNDQFGREFQLANMYQGQAQDPFQMVLGRSGAVAQAQGAAGQAAYTQGAGAKLFDPFNSSLMQIYSGNQANDLAARTATANNKSDMGGATMGAVGAIGGAALIAF